MIGRQDYMALRSMERFQRNVERVKSVAAFVGVAILMGVVAWITDTR